MRRLALSLVLLAACTKAGHESSPGEPSPKPTPAVAPLPPKTSPAKPATRIELTAVTLADDCGGSTPSALPAPAPAKREATVVKDAKSKSKSDASFARGERRCEQTSMQLAIMAGSAAKIHVQSVELFDDTGKSLGTLAASKPTRWSDAAAIYEAWDETIAAGSTTNVSYVLAQPKWDQIADRWNKTFTLKTVVSIDGVDQTAQRSVTLTAPTSLPPNVKT